MAENPVVEMLMVLILVAIGVGVIVVMARGFASILNVVQGQGSHWYRPEDQGVLNRLPLDQRRRLAKLARSKSRIDDQETSSKAQAACRAELAVIDGVHRSRSWIVALPMALLVFPLLRVATGAATALTWVVVAVVIVNITALAFIYPKWTRSRKDDLQETARMNSWDLS